MSLAYGGKLDLRPFRHDMKDGGQLFVPSGAPEHDLRCDWTDRTLIMFCDEGAQAVPRVHEKDPKQNGREWMKHGAGERLGIQE